MTTTMLLRRTAGAGLLLGLVGCIPYTIGSTAQTAPVGEQIRTTTAGFVIGGGSDLQDADGGNGNTNMPMSDVEVRWGLTDHSDLGIRLQGRVGSSSITRRAIRARHTPIPPGSPR